MDAREQEKIPGTVFNRVEAAARKTRRGKVMKQNEKIDKRIEREASNLASPSGVTDWAQPVSELLIGRLTL
jgi:hypothetical protein